MQRKCKRMLRRLLRLEDRFKGRLRHRNRTWATCPRCSRTQALPATKVDFGIAQINGKPMEPLHLKGITICTIMVADPMFHLAICPWFQRLQTTISRTSSNSLQNLVTRPRASPRQKLRTSLSKRSAQHWVQMSYESRRLLPFSIRILASSINLRVF